MTKSESFKASEETINPPTSPEQAGAHDQLSFPELTPSKYPPVTKDIVKIDEHGRQMLQVFFRKSFFSFFELSQQFPRAFLYVTQEVNSSLLQVISENKQRKASSLLVIKERFFGEIRKLADQYESLLEYQHMETGISWYIYRLQQDLSSYPRTLTIKYNKEDFRIIKGDTPALRWLKVRRNLSSLFARHSVYADIRYRDALAYYLRDSRYMFLSSWLDEFKRTALEGLRSIQAFVALCDERFGDLFRQTQSGTLTVHQWELASQEMSREANNLVQVQQQMSELFLNRLLVEFRKNVDHLRTHLEHIDADRLTRNIPGDSRLYKTSLDRCLSFGEKWYAAIALESKKISLDAILRSFRWQVEHEIKDFTYRFESCITKTIQDPLEQTLLFLEQPGKHPKELTALKKIEWVLPKEILKKDFTILSDHLIQYTKGFPEKIAIPPPSPDSTGAGLTNGMTVPIKKLVQHFLEQTLLGPLHDLVQGSLEKIKGSVFNINDQLSLTIFNIENINTRGEADVATIQQLATNARQGIKPEVSIISGLKQDLTNKISESTGRLFEPLSIGRISATTVDFTHLSRDFRSKRFMTRFGLWVEKARRFTMEKFLILIYSRSEGIRIAQRISSRSEAKSVTERSLEVVDRVTPSSSILNALPHHYLNLFSGRSSIGESFWVNQETEEKQIEQAIGHYFKGYHGGILVLGERNAGKTALCRRIADIHFRKNKVFHLFPGEDGSRSTDDFVNNLSAATGISSDLTGILNSLPYHTVIIIHDLELWWERTAEGMDVIRMIIEMIATNSDRFIFIVNMNPFAYNLINLIEPIHERFIGVIRCLPLSSIELKQMIMTRHRSSGMTFSLSDGKLETSEIKLASMFNYYFNYSEGNPGVAMSAWLNSIIHISDKHLTIKPPVLPNSELLDQLPGDWSVLLIQLILHKRMSIEKLQRVFAADFPALRMTLNSLVRAGLILERAKDLYVLNPYVEPFVVKAFKEKEWL